MRIHILGPSGSGKTFLSTKLSNDLNLKIIDLDKIEWKNINNISIKRDNSEKEKLLFKELKKNNIIVEGVYYKWCDLSFKKSDYIFYVDTPIIKQQYRIIRRSIRRKIGKEKSYVKETFKSVYNLFVWNIKYNLKYKNEIFNKLEIYKEKVYIIKKYDDILNIIEGGRK